MISVERETALALHREFYQQGRSDQQAQWLLITHGIEGVGKSNVLRQIRKELQTEQVKMIYLDFARASLHDQFTILEQIISELTDSCKEQAIERFEEELKDGRRQMSIMASQLNNITQVINAQDQARVTDNSLSILSDKLSQEIQKGLKGLVDNLTTFFKKVVRTLREDGLVILLDNFEWLSERDSDIDYWLMNSLLPDLHEDLTRRSSNKQCLVMMTSRMKPPLDVIKQEQRHTITLLPWNRETVAGYLQQEKIHAATLHELVFAQTEGHAYSVTLFCNVIKEYGYDAQLEIRNTSQLVALFLRAAWQSFVQEQILARLHRPFDELLRYGVVTEYFTQHKWATIFPELLPGMQARNLFECFVRYPSVQFNLQQNAYTIAPLLRQIILNHLSNEESDQFKKYHEREEAY